MKIIQPSLLSKTYEVRTLQIQDAPMIYAFCKRHTPYYAYCGKDVSLELIEHDIQTLPPGISMEQKYYVGFFEKNDLIAIMDLIIGYPSDSDVFIGFFMINSERQGLGLGSHIVSHALEYLQKQGFQACQLAMDKANPQSTHFWHKNGFTVTREIEMEEGSILVAEKELSFMK